MQNENSTQGPTSAGATTENQDRMSVDVPVISLRHPRVDSLSPHLLLKLFQAVVDVEFKDEEELYEQMDELDPISQRHFTKNAPLNLSCVNKAWRRVALSNASLWNKSFLMEPGLGENKRASIWIERSAKLPLSIYLEGSRKPVLRRETGSKNSPLNQYKTFFSELLDSDCKRWRQIKMFSRSVMTCPLNPRSIPLISAPILEDVSISLPYYTFTDDQFIIFNMKMCPKVRSMQLEGPFALMLNPNVSLLNLTDLNLQYNQRPTPDPVVHPCGQDIVAILSGAPNLQSLRIVPSSERSEVRKKIRHTNLRTLSISASEIYSESREEERKSLAFLNALTLPSLETLEVYCEKPHSVFDTFLGKNVIHGLLERSRAPILNLLLEGQSLRVNASLGVWLRLLPQLKNLTLKNCFVMDDLLSHLTQQPPLTTCPALEAVSFAKCFFVSSLKHANTIAGMKEGEREDSKESISLLLNFIKGRCQPQGALKEIEICHSRAAGLLQDAQMQLYIKSGLKAHVRDHSA